MQHMEFERGDILKCRPTCSDSKNDPYVNTIYILEEYQKYNIAMIELKKENSILTQRFFSPGIEIMFDKIDHVDITSELSTNVNELLQQVPELAKYLSKE